MQGFLTILYIYRFLDSFVLIFPIFTLLFRSQGLSVFQIALLLSVWSISTVTLGLSSGVLLDKYDRKTILILGSMLRALGFAFWIFGGFWGFMIGFVLWGVKNAVSGGSFEALLYDSLENAGKSEEFAVINKHMEGLKLLGIVTSAMLGGFMAEESFFNNLMIGLWMSVLSGVIILFLGNVPRVYEFGTESILRGLKSVPKEVMGNSSLIFVLMHIGVVFGIYAALIEYMALIFWDLGIGIGYIGLLVGLILIITGLSGFLKNYFEKINFMFRDQIFIALGGFLLIAFNFNYSLLALPLVFLAIFLIQSVSLQFESKLTRLAKEGQKTFVYSYKSILFEVFFVAYLILLGIYADIYGLSELAWATGVTLVVSSVTFFILSLLLFGKKGF